jgi:hypothetical protein
MVTARQRKKMAQTTVGGRTLSLPRGRLENSAQKTPDSKTIASMDPNIPLMSTPSPPQKNVLEQNHDFHAQIA